LQLSVPAAQPKLFLQTLATQATYCVGPVAGVQFVTIQGGGPVVVMLVMLMVLMSVMSMLLIVGP
jgi:hypothetical protein